MMMRHARPTPGGAGRSFATRPRIRWNRLRTRPGAPPLAVGAHRFVHRPDRLHREDDLHSERRELVRVNDWPLPGVRPPVDEPVPLEPREGNREVVVPPPPEERLELEVAAGASDELDEDAAAQVAVLGDEVVG